MNIKEDTMDRITNDPTMQKIIGLKRYEANKPAKNSEKEGNTGSEKQDAISISQESRIFSEKIENLKATVKNEVSDARSAKLEEVKEKLKTGFYEKDEIAEEVADKIIEQTGCKIVILGVGEDFKFAKLIKDNMKHAAIILKNFSIPQTAALLKRCKFIISTDAGPSHIAKAMGTSCITIFGRNQPGLSPTRWKPFGEDVIVLHKDVGCVECLAHKCKRHFACIEAITVGEVLDAAKKFM